MIVLLLTFMPILGQSSLTDEQILQIKAKVEKIQKENKITKPKWFENKYAWYGYGVFTVIGNIWLYDKVKN